MNMHVTGLTLDIRTGHHLVILTDEDEQRALIVAVGLAEAMAIHHAMQNHHPDRPLTHDLLIKGLDEAGFTITNVEIGGKEGNTYLSTIHLQPKSAQAYSTGLRSLDARPSDAIALSILANVPIVASPEVFADGSVPFDLEKEKRDSEAFKHFVENVKASDFRLDGPELLGQE